MTDEVAVKARAAYVGPELDYANWGRIGNAIRFVRGFYPETWDDLYCGQLLERFQLTADEKITTLSFGSRTKLALVIALSRTMLSLPVTAVQLARCWRFVVIGFPVMLFLAILLLSAEIGGAFGALYLSTEFLLLIAISQTLTLDTSHPWRTGVMKGLSAARPR